MKLKNKSKYILIRVVKAFYTKKLRHNVILTLIEIEKGTLQIGWDLEVTRTL